MAPEVAVSTTSLDDSRADDGLTDTNSSSITSDEDLHIGFSPRPQLPFILSSSSISKGLPSGFGRGVASRGSRPPRHHSAHARPTCNCYQRGLSHSPRPPPLHPPPPLIRSTSSGPPRSSDRHDIWHNGLSEPQYGGHGASHNNGGNGFSHSPQKGGEPELEPGGEVDCVQALTEHYDELQSQRSRLSANIKNVEAQRVRVRELRQTQDVADEKFMAAAEALLPESSQLHQLRQLFAAMRNTRLGYQEAQQRLEESMDGYHHNQEDLQLREETFYKTALGALGAGFLDVDQDQHSHPNTSEDWALRGITSDRPEIVHPLYGKLLAAFGELQLARELLVNTQMKRNAFHARKSQPVADDSLALIETYGDVGKKKALELRAMALMTEDDIEQLQLYDELEQNANQDIEIYAEKVRILQQQCRENGVLPISSDFQQEGFGLDSFYRDEIRLAPGPFNINDESATLAHPVFPLLLSNPTHLLDDFPRTAVQSLKAALQLPLHTPVRARQVREAAREVTMQRLLSTAESDDKSEYINRWLLHKLHYSAMEAELLWSTFRSRLKILDIDRWQQDVLQFWWRDEPVDVGVNIISVGFGDNDTDKLSKLAGSFVESDTLGYSVAEQSDHIRGQNLNNLQL
ncbi:hypothetical protein ONZ43_g2960 [Nemania bipapillata]|uniref:Uncharacterized protein n=1 Tax=Nemania bipapillata TaxID=110536 RepID=A0ACC2IYP3_9PEZI|nr:hypothetical protein ONZ43_g2960 [Nemania bipapillata]